MTEGPLISVVLPTVDGREEWLERAIASYESHANVELLVIRNQPTCGIAWQQGSEEAAGEYLHLGADDLEMHSGWWQAAVEKIDEGKLPAPRVLNSDGSLQSCGEWDVEMLDGAACSFTRVPFMSRAQWQLIGPMIPTHYFTDNWVSWRGRQHRIETVVARGYECTHHLAGESRNEARMLVDQLRFIGYQEFPP